MAGRYLGGVVVAAAMMAGGTAHAETKYRPRGLLKTGYSERVAGPGIWEVKGSSRESGGSVAVALYRAAELATADGVREIRVVRQKIKSTTVTRRDGSMVGYSEVANVTVRAVRSDADRTACAMPEAAKCLTIPVAGILARYGPEMGMPAARAGEAPAEPVNLVQSGRFPGFPLGLNGRGYTTPADRYPAWRAMLAGRAWKAATAEKAAAVPVSAPAAGASPVAVVPVAVVPVAAVPVTVVPASIVPATVIPVAARPVAVAPVDVVAVSPRSVPAPRFQPAAMPEPTAYAARLAAARPVTGRDPKQGWTISD